MAGHRNKSHQDDYELVAEIPITDFKDNFVIIRIRHAGEVKAFLGIVNNPAYWKVIRKFPKIQNTLFSGLSNGENSLSEILYGKIAQGVSFLT
jgi:hypothetical protein